MRTANPALNSKTFDTFGITYAADDVMSIQGAVNKAALLLFLVLIAAAWTWSLYYTSDTPEVVMPWMIGGAIGGFIVALVTGFKKNWAAVTAPIYCLLEGLFLGGISSILEAQCHGIVIQAVGLTFGTLLCLLVAYKTGAIRATEN
ncbi:Bax inhibitor-1/YccA family protein, partial [Candidatus Poribacteria bacterium]|nr:Bax inhibitor-1/YccA family protein [Candidatus Poribacteria bacterium]